MKILFVDDDPRVLGSLEDAIERDQPNWTAKFVDNGASALETLEQDQIDVIVSDMCMGEMDGADLLGEVAGKYPQTVRIVLSGRASEDAVYRAVNPMHQYLAKPCDISSLRESLDRALAIRDMLYSTKLRDLIAKISHLPSVPTVYNELLDELATDEYNAVSIGEIVSVDPALTAKILQIVNSAIIGLSRPCSSVSQAVGLLGTDTIKSLVLSAGTYNQFDDPPVAEISIQRLASHGLEVATLATRICQEQGVDANVLNTAFTSGLLHDIGKIILAHEFADEYVSLIQAQEQGRSLYSDEQMYFGTNHAEVAAYLFSLWGLPHDVVEAIAWHHEPQMERKSFSAVTAVASADYLLDSNPTESQTDAIKDHLNSIGLEESLDDWRSLVRN